MNVASTFAPAATLAANLWPLPARAGGGARACALAFGGALALTVAAKIQIPFYPAPMTMQTFVVLFLGLALGRAAAVAAVALYLAQGALGLPVFAGGGGWAYMAGPTGGYLAGFLAAAFAAGWLAERGAGRGVVSALAAATLAAALIYVFGVLWLAQFVGWGKVWAAGVAPFLLAEAAKIALAAALLPAAWKFGGKSQ